MKKLVIMSLIVLINFIFQTSLYNFVNIYGVIPNVSIILVVLFSISSNSIIGGYIGFLTGLLYDAMIMDIFGINTLIYFVIGAVLGTFSEEINRENNIIYTGAVLLSSIFMQIVTFILLYFLKYDMNNSALIINKIMLEIFLNTVLCFLVVKFIIYIFGRFGIKLISK